MPWKNEVKDQGNVSSLQKENLAKVVSTASKEKVLDIDLSKHATDVQAILINPPWVNAFE
jgi:hypothetical protein